MKSNGEVWAWGNNRSGQLGNDSVAFVVSIPVKVVNESDFIQITAGFHHSLALKSNGEVWAWGLNHLGQLGDNSTTQSSTPVKVVSQSNFVEISAGSASSFARKST